MFKIALLSAAFVVAADGSNTLAQTADANVQAALDGEATKLADHFQINVANAKMAVQVMVDLAAAKRAAKTDLTGVSDAKAAFLEKRATVLIVGSQVVHEGEALITLAQHATPGSPIPPDVSDRTTAWLAKAGQYELLAADLDVAGAAYVAATATMGTACESQANTDACMTAVAEASATVDPARSDAIGAARLVTNLVSQLSATRLTY